MSLIIPTIILNINCINICIIYTVSVLLHSQYSSLKSRTGSGLVDLAGTRPAPRFFSERVFKVPKKTVDNIYSLKPENVEILLFMK